MKTCEEIFFQEFNQMLNQRRATRGTVALNDIPIPSEIIHVDTRDKVMLRGITEPYFDKLANTEAILWAKPKLLRRKFDYKGEYIMRKDDPTKYELQEVTLPNKCAAILSDIQIGVPYSQEDRHGKKKLYKPSEGFEYVDVINKIDETGKRIIKYIYIIPKTYCYKENMVALIISFNRLRSYYSGAAIPLTNGQMVFLHVIPYKPTSGTPKNYRVITTKTSTQDCTEEFNKIITMWRSADDPTRAIMFNPDDCQITEGIKGRENLAFELLPPVLEEFISYDELHSMADNTDVVDEEGIFEE